MPEKINHAIPLAPRMNLYGEMKYVIGTAKSFDIIAKMNITVNTCDNVVIPRALMYGSFFFSKSV